MKNPALTSTHTVILRSDFVSINRSRINEYAKSLARSPKFSVPTWDYSSHFYDPMHASRTLDYLFLLDALNFCFWSPKETRWHFTFQKKKYNGYYALSLALKDFFEQHPLVRLQDFAKIYFKDFSLIFQGGKNLLFLKERWQIARSVARTIEKKGGTVKFVGAAKGRFTKLVPAIAYEIPSFRDEGNYKGSPVFFWKRAQILAGDIYGTFRGQGIGSFKDINYLTAFADYKIPQILYHFGMMEYAPSLKLSIEKFSRLKPGSPEEIEIRSATIWTVEFLREALLALGITISAFELDWLLWNKSQNIILDFPHHRTKTIFY